MVFMEFWRYMFKWNVRATRKQYLLPTLVYNSVYILLFIITGDVTRSYGTISIHNNNFLVVIIGIFLFIAQFTLTARRLHDSYRPTGWLALNLLPLIGQIWLFILCLMPNKKRKKINIDDMPIQGN